jgi:hypothetical protein
VACPWFLTSGSRRRAAAPRRSHCRALARYGHRGAFGDDARVLAGPPPAAATGKRGPEVKLCRVRGAEARTGDPPAHVVVRHPVGVVLAVPGEAAQPGRRGTCHAGEPVHDPARRGAHSGVQDPPQGVPERNAATGSGWDAARSEGAVPPIRPSAYSERQPTKAARSHTDPGSFRAVRPRPSVRPSAGASAPRPWALRRAAWPCPSSGRSPSSAESPTRRRRS